MMNDNAGVLLHVNEELLKRCSIRGPVAMKLEGCWNERLR